MAHRSDSSYYTLLYTTVYENHMANYLKPTYSSGQHLPDSIPWVDPSQDEMDDIFKRLLGGGSAHSLSF
jgi:hypothetical protein